MDGLRAGERLTSVWLPNGAASSHVTPGDTVAYAHALLRCGTADDLASKPGPPAAADSRPAQGGRPVARRPRAPLVRDETGPDESGPDDREASEREVRALHRR